MEKLDELLRTGVEDNVQSYSDIKATVDASIASLTEKLEGDELNRSQKITVRRMLKSVTPYLDRDERIKASSKSKLAEFDDKFLALNDKRVELANKLIKKSIAELESADKVLVTIENFIKEL